MFAQGYARNICANWDCLFCESKKHCPLWLKDFPNALHSVCIERYFRLSEKEAKKAIKFGCKVGWFAIHFAPQLGGNFVEITAYGRNAFPAPKKKGISVVQQTLAPNGAAFTSATSPAPSTRKTKPEWEMPRLPERLRKLAIALIDAGGKSGADELRLIIGFDPSRVYHDYKRKTLADWIKGHIKKEGRGVYCWLPMMRHKMTSKRAQKRTVKLSK